jgi:hypothetical protein
MMNTPIGLHTIQQQENNNNNNDINRILGVMMMQNQQDKEENKEERRLRHEENQKQQNFMNIIMLRMLATPSPMSYQQQQPFGLNHHNMIGTSTPKNNAVQNTSLHSFFAQAPNPNQQNVGVPNNMMGMPNNMIGHPNYIMGLQNNMMGSQNNDGMTHNPEVIMNLLGMQYNFTYFVSTTRNDADAANE